MTRWKDSSFLRDAGERPKLRRAGKTAERADMLKLFLRLFDGEGGGEGGAEGSAPGAIAEGVDQSTARATITEGGPQESGKASFADLLKDPDYKREYDGRVQAAIQQRFKNQADLQGQLDSYAPLMEMLGSKYGIDGSDVNAVLEAVQNDDSYYEEEAMQQGLTVEQLKYIKKIERETAALKQAQEEAQRRQASEQIYNRWMAEAEDLKRTFPNFDLQAEAENPVTGESFLRMLQNGVPVRTAYQVTHMDEIMSGAMAYTAQQTAKKVTDTIQARGARPAENGRAATARVVSTDPGRMTKAEREELSRRAQRGERITFNNN